MLILALIIRMPGLEPRRANHWIWMGLMHSTERAETGPSRVAGVYRVIGQAVLIFLAGHYLYGGADFAKGLLETSAPVDQRHASPVYDDYPEKIEFWTEFSQVKEVDLRPYFHWRHAAFTGKYVNIDSEGVRRTIKPAAAAPGAKKIMVFGGSSVWGTGVPDAKTIPSILQSMLGDGYDVYNYGEIGYVAAQELNYLLYQLSRGNVPDAVIFYDGVNDGYDGAYAPAVPREPNYNWTLRPEPQDRNLFLKVLEQSNYPALARAAVSIYRQVFTPGQQSREWDEKITSHIAKNSVAVVDVYEAHVKQVRALGRAYGFKAFFFWQPNLFSLTRKTNSQAENEMIDAASPALVASQQQVYRLAKERFSGREDEGIFFLGELFNEVEEPVYIDWPHLGPNGNQRVVEAMLERLGDKI